MVEMGVLTMTSLSLFGSTLAGVSVVDAAPSCGLASVPTALSVWCTVIGDGGMIAASTRAGTDRDSQASVFAGSCGQLTCVDGNDDASGSQSRVDFRSTLGQTYDLLVFGDASGNFALQTVPTRLVNLIDLFVNCNLPIEAMQELSSPQHEAFAWMTNDDSNDLQSTLSDNELAEHFVLVVLCFATNRESWLDQAGFLDPFNARCSWMGRRAPSVSCNDEGSVVTLDLRELLHSSTF
jgi:hypothetical protein